MHIPMRLSPCSMEIDIFEFYGDEFDEAVKMNDSLGAPKEFDDGG
jgi:hypothetical protein